MLLDPRNGPAYDTPASQAVPRWWFLASTPRTGSTMLARALWETRRVGAPKEYLNPTQVRDWEVRLGDPASRVRHRLLRGPAVGLAGRGWWSAPRRQAYLHRIAQRRAGPTGWVGLKVHHHHFARWFGSERPDFPVRWVRISRADPLGQALSWHRALQTGAWAAHRPSKRPARYHRAAIEARLADIALAEAAWDRLLADVPTLDLTYEALTTDLTGTVNRVLDWLDEPPVGSVSPPLPRQADALTDAWRRRFLAGR